MTINKRYQVNLGDLQALCITCTCGAILSIPIKPTEYLPEQCPACRANRWFKGSVKELNSIMALVSIISTLRDREEPACQLTFDIEQPN